MLSSTFRILVAAPAILVCANLCAARQNSQQVQVDGGKVWVDTSLMLRAGEKLKFSATGTITYSSTNSKGETKQQSFGPNGIARGFADLIHQYAVPDGGHGSLIARIGNGEAAQAFAIGERKEFTAPVAGELFLGINESGSDAEKAQGAFQVTIEITDAGRDDDASKMVGGPAESTAELVKAEVVNGMPRRVSDPQGNPGDMVNILIVGTQEQMVAAFTNAGWVKVDSSVSDTLVAGFVNSMEKKDYLTMPMSTLFLFNRAQDFGFAHAEPVRVVMSRNHLRVWKSADVVDGQPIWCVAATHDIGFERDQRNGGLTHKIDPEIDKEREFVNETLSATGLVAARAHATPANALTGAKTATGGSFSSDGRILILVLTK